MVDAVTLPFTFAVLLAMPYARWLSGSGRRAAGDRRQSGAITEADSTVETTDNDTAVYADAEGAGGQGRAFSEPRQEAAESDAKTTGHPADTGQHIDIEA